MANLMRNYDELGADQQSEIEALLFIKNPPNNYYCMVKADEAYDPSGNYIGELKDYNGDLYILAINGFVYEAVGDDEGLEEIEDGYTGHILNRVVL
jgi:hypothetical protein